MSDKAKKPWEDDDDEPAPRVWGDSPENDPMLLPEQHLPELEKRFLDVLEWIREGRLVEAEEELLAILRVEPRLAEPRMELCRLRLERGALEDAEHEARESLRLLEAGGIWNLDLDEATVVSIAHDLLGEVLRRRCEEEEDLLDDPRLFRKTLLEARGHFRRAAELDSTNEHAAWYAFHLGLEGEEPLWAAEDEDLS